ncbi:MAG: hypothetical protein J1F04_10465, partial [Oscillospiraceae bacterium]|nr:hypothetical protein [Oscillospiraceae bacterium]
MTEHEFFKMLNNIDDELVVGAKPSVGAMSGDTDGDPEIELYGDTKPLKIAPKRRPVWKSVMAVAACLVVIGAVIGIVLAVNKQRGNMIDDPVQPSNSSYNPLYPDEVVPFYRYSGDFSELEPTFYSIAELAYPENFFELAYESDLIVVGTFTDDAWQYQPLTGDINRSNGTFNGQSYNTLRIDEVYKGNIVVGTEIVIGDNYIVNDGKLIYVSGYTSTPMIKGDRWVYFLTKSTLNDIYYSTRSYCGRSPVPGYENTFALSDEAGGMVGNVMAFPEIGQMLEKDPSVLRMIRIDYEGKRYNTVGFMNINGVHYLVGTTKTQYEMGENIEVIGVVENNTDYTIGLYTMENSGGGCHG